MLKSEQVSVSQFAAMAVAGLQSRNTVAKYRKAWKLAIDNGFATDRRVRVLNL